MCLCVRACVRACKRVWAYFCDSGGDMAYGRAMALKEVISLT